MTYSLSNKAFRHILFSLILVLGVALSILVSILSYYTGAKLIRSEFNEAAETRYFAMRREIDRNLDVLTSLQALYYSSEDIERSEFRIFTSYLLKEHESIQVLGWVSRVPDSRREAYESSVRSGGFPDFQITERLAQGKMKRAEKRKEYFPVYFVEPYTGNEIVFGFDNASNPSHMEALEAARKTGKMLATERITLVQETTGQFGFIVFAPVYRKGALINSYQARWDNLEGFALGEFRISDIVEKAINSLKPEGVDFFIYDASATEKEQFLYTHASRTYKTPLLNKKQPETGLRYTKTLDVAGRKWRVIFSATPDFIAARSSWRPWGFLLGGLAFTGLLAGFLFIIARHSEQVEKLAIDLSKTNIDLSNEIVERRRANEMIELLSHQNELILKSVGEGIYGVDLNGNTTFINPSAIKMTGWEAGELIGKLQHDILHHTKADGTPYPQDNCPIYSSFKDGNARHVNDEVFWKKDGSSFPVDYTSTPIIEGSSCFSVGHFISL